MVKSNNSVGVFSFTTADKSPASCDLCHSEGYVFALFKKQNGKKKPIAKVCADCRKPFMKQHVVLCSTILLKLSEPSAKPVESTSESKTETSN